MPVTGGGGPAPAAGAGAAGGGAPKQFADLGEYLRVNQPQEFGQQLAGKIGQDIDQGQQTLQDASNQFGERVDAATIRDNQGLIDQVSTAPELIDPDQFATLRDAQYQGPRSLAETPDLYNQVQGASGSAVGKAQASGSEAGRFALLDNYFGRPEYSQGQKSLDNLLVQADPNSQQAFDQMRANAKQLQDSTNQAGVDLNARAGQARQQTQDTRQAARGALGIDDVGQLTGSGAIQSSLAPVDERLTQQQQRLSQIQDIMGQYGDSTAASQLTPEMLELLGIDPAQFNEIKFGGDGGRWLPFSVAQGEFAAPLSSFVDTASEDSLNRASVSSPEEAARLNALASLAGMDPSGIIGAGDAGSMYEQPLLSVGDLPQQQRQAMQAELQAAIDQIIQEEQLKGEWSTTPEEIASIAMAIKQKYGVADPLYIPSGGAGTMNSNSPFSTGKPTTHRPQVIW